MLCRKKCPAGHGGASWEYCRKVGPLAIRTEHERSSPRRRAEIETSCSELCSGPEHSRRSRWLRAAGTRGRRGSRDDAGGLTGTSAGQWASAYPGVPQPALRTAWQGRATGAAACASRPFLPGRVPTSPAPGIVPPGSHVGDPSSYHEPLFECPCFHIGRRVIVKLALRLLFYRATVESPDTADIWLKSSRPRK